MLQTGLIEDLDQDFHEPSIAVNEFGNVVIGYTCSGDNLAPSTCVSLGETIGGVTLFEAPTILQTGDGHYYRDGRNPDTGTPTRNRWGDYSATVIDPVDPCTFWTFQEFVATSAVGDVGPSPRPQGGRWGTQITELTFNACAEADLSITKADTPDPVAAGGEVLYTLNVDNGGPSRAHDVTVTDTLPAGVQFVSAEGVNWNCSNAGSTVTCAWEGGNPIGSLANGQVADPIEIVVIVDADVVDDVGSATLVNEANVESSITPDPDESNNTATEGTDVLPGCGGLFATIAGTPGNEILRGSSGPDVIAGLSGNDVIFARQGDDVVCGGKGNDTVFAGAGNDEIDGNAGNDSINGGSGVDTCTNGEALLQCSP